MKTQERYSKQIDVPGAPLDLVESTLPKMISLGYLNCVKDVEKLTLYGERYGQRTYIRFTQPNDSLTHVLIEGTSEETVRVILNIFNPSIDATENLEKDSNNNKVKQSLTAKGDADSWLHAAYLAFTKNGFSDIDKDDMFFSVSGNKNDSSIFVQINNKGDDKVCISLEADNAETISLFKNIVAAEFKTLQNNNNTGSPNNADAMIKKQNTVSSYTPPSANQSSKKLNSNSALSNKNKIGKGCLGCLGLIVILALIIFMVSMCSNPQSTSSSSTSSTPTPTTATATVKPTTAPLPTTNPEELKASATALSYDEMARYPDNYIGKSVVVTGEVIQVLEGTNETDFRVKMNDDYDQIVLVAYTGTFVNGKILEGDTVSFYGKYAGTTTYKSTLGASITVPALLSTLYE